MQRKNKVRWLYFKASKKKNNLRYENDVQLLESKICNF